MKAYRYSRHNRKADVRPVRHHQVPHPVVHRQNGKSFDLREARYILARQEDFSADLNLLRRRYRELSGAPAVADSRRLPERPLVNDLLAFNRAYRQHIDVRQPLELIHWWELRTALQETDRLYQVWDAVRDARCDYYYVTVRWQALTRLREEVAKKHTTARTNYRA